MSETIPMSSPDISDLEVQAVLDVIRTPRLSIGPQVEQFERAVASRVGVQHAIAVNSGTTALHLCILAAGIGAGDLVITTPFSFVASANVILYERAIPVFVDIDPITGNIDPELVHRVTSDLQAGGEARESWLPPTGANDAGSLKMLLPVDVFAQPADYSSLRNTANEFGLVILEDSCEALGSEYEGTPAGALGDMGTFGFYPNKQVTTGEGGMVVTDHDEWAGMMRAFRNQGRNSGDRWLEHTYLGYNYRMDELSAALGRAQMERLDELMRKRAGVADMYEERLAAVQEVEVPAVIPSTSRMSWFVYVVRLAPGISREAVIDTLATQGIPSRPYFAPIHFQPFYTERYGYRPGMFPVTEDLGDRSLALPFSGVMGEQEVERICTALTSAVQNPS